MNEDGRNEPGPVFLTAEHVIALHQRQLDRFGGGAGLRDRGLLESAVAQPQASFGGAFAHEGLFAMAAAYLFHIVSNHPFVDGNKRTTCLGSALPVQEARSRLLEAYARVHEQLDLTVHGVCEEQA